MATASDQLFRRAFQFFLSREEREGTAREAIALARAEREARRRGWWLHWRDSEEEEGLDDVFLLVGDAREQTNILGIMPGVRRTDADVREAAAWLALEALTEERRRA